MFECVCDLVGENSSFTALSYATATRRIVHFIVRSLAWALSFVFILSILPFLVAQEDRFVNCWFWRQNIPTLKHQSFSLYVCVYVFAYLAEVKQSISILHVRVRHIERTRDPCRRYYHVYMHTHIYNISSAKTSIGEEDNAIATSIMADWSMVRFKCVANVRMTLLYRRAHIHIVHSTRFN